MLPGMQAKPRVAIVGAGNLGTALALALRSAGYAIPAIVSRAKESSRRRARGLAKQVSTRIVSELSIVNVEVVWLCVPDSEIAGVAEQLAKSATSTSWKGRVALHASGALTSEELEPLRARGAAVASVHPMMTFVKGSRPSLVGVPFAIEGDAAAVRVARRIVRDLGGRAYAIRKRDKAAYHAWGTFVSPLFTALLATSERVASRAGVKRSDAARRAIPILMQTLANYAQLGPAVGFSGPIVRGDVETVRRHLRVLRTVPAAYNAYVALANAALEYLPSRNKAALKRVLSHAAK